MYLIARLDSTSEASPAIIEGGGGGGGPSMQGCQKGWGILDVNL